jgi:hypothetical protein
LILTSGRSSFGTKGSFDLSARLPLLAAMSPPFVSIPVTGRGATP